jgi:hypothetical protein
MLQSINIIKYKKIQSKYVFVYEVLIELFSLLLINYGAFEMPKFINF